MKEKNSITSNLLDEGLEKTLGQHGFHLDRTAETAQELISILEK